MKEVIRESVKNASSLDEVRDLLIEVFQNFQESGHTRIGYVAGIITSEGRENILANIKRLAGFTEKVRQEQDFPIFSSTDVFSDELFDRLSAAGFTNKDWGPFWRDVVGSGYITDIFMTPRWEISKGSRDEHETAQKHELEIHYIDSET